MINQSIFRSYDIRGEYPGTLNKSAAYKIGYNFVRHYLQQPHPSVIIGYDGRLSSPPLAQFLTLGLTSAGARVTNIGCVPTPALYYAEKVGAPDAAIMITGSHNHKQINGFKIILNGAPFFADQLTTLYQHITRDGSEHTTPVEHSVMCKYESFNSAYINNLLSSIKRISPNISCVWDAGGGAAGPMIRSLAKKLPNKNHLLNCRIDGSFSARAPDPTVKSNLAQLMEMIATCKADIGVAFDGDGDRLVVVSASGRMLHGDELLAIYCRQLMTKTLPPKIIADIKANPHILDHLKEQDIEVILSKTGHPWIKQKMQETGALLGGEVSGHMFFADKYLGFDDGIYAALRILELMTIRNNSVDELLDTLPISYTTPEIRIPLGNNSAEKILNQIIYKIALDNEQVIINKLDGIKAIYQNKTWILVRQSNTEPILVARFGARDKQSFERVSYKLKQYLLPLSYSL